MMANPVNQQTEEYAIWQQFSGKGASHAVVKDRYELTKHILQNGYGKLEGTRRTEEVQNAALVVRLSHTVPSHRAELASYCHICVPQV